MEMAAVSAPDACGAGAESPVLALEAAVARAVALAHPVQECERLPLLDAAGRVVANSIVAGIDLPPFDNSAMDGYAVRLADLAGEGPWQLRLAGSVAAGDRTFEALAPAGTAFRIFTGAPVPAGFDAVIMQENCRVSGDNVSITSRPRPGENIRLAGEDLARGSRMTEPGALLTPQKLALLAGTGVADVDVFRKVRIGLISTGSELKEPGDRLEPGQIYNSNRMLLRAMLASQRWAEIVDFGIVPDRRPALAEAIGRAAERCDVLITTGGVSAGEEDHVVGALALHGATLDVMKVAMRPGKPVKIGRVGKMLVAGLPGNPNAVLVTFRQIALPAIRTVAGLAVTGPDWLPAVAGFSYRKKIGRTEFVPVRMAGRDEAGRPVLEMLERGSSASLSAMAAADGIAVLAPEAENIENGETLRFEPFCHC